MKQGDKVYRYEWLVVTDARVAGSVQIEPHYSLSALMAPSEDWLEQYLILRTQEVHKLPKTSKTGKKGYYLPEGVPHELVMLASLFLGRRLTLCGLIRHDDSPLMPPLRPSLNGRRAGECVDLAETQEGFKQALGLRRDKQTHQRFIHAVRSYNQALQLVDSMPDVAYLLLVCAMEALAVFHPVEKSLADVDESLPALLKRVEDPRARGEIEQKFLAMDRSNTKKFVGFVVQHTGQSFWESRTANWGHVEASRLPELMKDVYDYRSRFVHESDPLPPSIYTPLPWDMDPSTSVASGNRVWVRDPEAKGRRIAAGRSGSPAGYYIPQPSFMMDLANHVIMQFLKTNQEPTSDCSQPLECM